ncbi:MAG: VOC family protein [Chromatiaceae bacterium]|nr:VOC family protein [Chromatiaceae bacterium]
MPEMTSFQTGSFCWADLATNDTEGAKSFYAGLFGWQHVDMPTDVGIPYTMLMKDGKQVCALYAMGPDQGGAPPHWQGYVAAEDADAVAAAVAEHGGRVLMPTMDVMDAGRMLMLQDPTGAVLGIWEPKQHLGAQLWNEPGAICWNELLTRDPDRAERFFGDLFGWTTKINQSVMEGKYRIFVNSGEQVGGMIRIAPEWGDMPPNWTLYLGVDDCDGTIAEAEKLGGRLLFPAMEIEHVGRFAYLQDPQGAVFAIIQHPA